MWLHLKSQGMLPGGPRRAAAAGRRRLSLLRNVLLFAVLFCWLGLQLQPFLAAQARARRPAPSLPPALPPPPQARLTVATGANSAYFLAMANLVGSVRFWCTECDIVAFNLGLTAEELRTARGWCRVTLHWADGYTHGDPNQYAFKALAIKEAVDAYGTVLWLDGGSTVTGHLHAAVAPLLAANGHFFVQGQDLDMVPWVHPGMLAHFGVHDTAPFAGKPSFSGNTVGFVRGSASATRILEPWVACARNVSCIAPPGSSKSNHRYDQAALSVIAYSSALSIVPHTELLAAQRQQLQPCEKASEMVVWTSRAGESCYAKYTHRGCQTSA